ncbi:unnamed protein product [Alopecurus aequalis]
MARRLLKVVSAALTPMLNMMYDSDYCGLAERENVVCKHNSIAAKFVCFEGYNTGRRFLACAGQDGGETCDFVQWVDAEWSSSLQKAVAKLWDNYAEQKEGRVNDALDSMEKKFVLQDEISKMHRDLKILQDEVDKVVEEKQLTLALKAKAEQALMVARAELEQKKRTDASTSNMHKLPHVMVAILDVSLGLVAEMVLAEPRKYERSPASSRDQRQRSGLVAVGNQVDVAMGEPVDAAAVNA